MIKSALTLALCFAICSCNLFRSQPQPVEREEVKSLHIGQVTSVHASQGFVLIRRGPGITVSAGTILISQGIDGSAANLRVSGESLGQMIAADIQSGTPQVGDSVRKSLIEEMESDVDSTESRP